MNPMLVFVVTFMTVSGWTIQGKHTAVAYITKVVKEVERRDSTTTDWIKALPGSELMPGCELRTNEGSFALIKFDDGSRVAVRSQSVVRILGDISHGKLQNPGVFIEGGQIIFNLNHQETEEFHFMSPISAAEIQKGEGGFRFDPGTGRAVLTVSSGSAVFSSTRVDCQLILRPGHTATIDSTGCRNH